MILSRAIAIERKLLFSKIGLIDQFRKAVFVPLRFLLFSWLILIRKMTSGGVLESSGSPLVDGHRDFQNRCRNGWENWSWSWHFEHRNQFSDCLSLSKWGLPTSTSIFSAISASILKISVPINKRRSWRFRNTPKHQLSDEYWPRKQQKTKKLSKLIKTPVFGDLPFSLNCHNLAQNNPIFASWGCFGILRTSSWWWAQRFLKLMHPGLRNWRKRESHSYPRQLYIEKPQ